MLRGPRDSDLIIGGQSLQRLQPVCLHPENGRTGFSTAPSRSPKPGNRQKSWPLTAPPVISARPGTPADQRRGMRWPVSRCLRSPCVRLTLKIWAERISSRRAGHAVGRGTPPRHRPGRGQADVRHHHHTPTPNGWTVMAPCRRNWVFGWRGVGLTGRLAKIVAPNTWRGHRYRAAPALAEFRLQDAALRPCRSAVTSVRLEHFYIHVVWHPEPCRSAAHFAIGDAGGILYDSRPRRFLPSGALFESQHHGRLQRLSAITGAGHPPEDPKNPPPTYVWQFRPEYQFSQFDLDMNALNGSPALGHHRKNAPTFSTPRPRSSPAPTT